MDRGMIWQAISSGGRIALSNEIDIFDDAKIINPVLVVAMPYIWNRLYPIYSKLLINKISQEEAYEIISKSLGENLIHVATGGAPISPEIFDLMKKSFKCSVTNEYGTTEVPGISSNGIIRESVKVKLVDVPELGYTNKDKPFPRGEIWCKSKTMTPGYFNLPEMTKKTFIDGYFLTGDIGMIDSEGLLHIIDRKKNVIELYLDGQSFWIPISNIESKLIECDKIEKLVIHGQRLSNYLIAIVVPREEYLKFDNIGIEILKDFSKIQQKYELKDFEIPKKILIDNTKWTIENGKLTQSGKLKRGSIIKDKMNEIEMMYTKIEKEENEI